jgi:hypothetical protein
LSYPVLVVEAKHQVCSRLQPSIQCNTLVSAHDFIHLAEHACKGASPLCGRTIPLVPLGGWTELKEGIIVERWEGLRLQCEWSNKD